jgi:hypothetical protein
MVPPIGEAVHRLRASRVPLLAPSASAEGRFRTISTAPRLDSPSSRHQETEYSALSDRVLGSRAA